MPIAENLKFMMELRGFTTDGLAIDSNIPASTITKIRTKKTLNPSTETLQALAKSLQCTVNDLVEVPSVEERELRELLPKNMIGVSEDLIEQFLKALRNQRLGHERTTKELRRDRDFWRKFTVICLGILIPITVVTMLLILFMYWDLSHPHEGNILLNYAQDYYGL